MFFIVIQFKVSPTQLTSSSFARPLTSKMLNLNCESMTFTTQSDAQAEKVDIF